MTGMKEGAGEDPFADDDERVTTESGGQTSRGDTQTSSERREETVDTERPSRQQMQIPYKFRRDGVQDGRDRVPLFLQSDSKRAERDALREVERRFDDNVALTDLREALIKVGLEHLNEVEDNLEEWGYGITFDE